MQARKCNKELDFEGVFKLKIMSKKQIDHQKHQNDLLVFVNKQVRGEHWWLEK